MTQRPHHRPLTPGDQLLRWPRGGDRRPGPHGRGRRPGGGAAGPWGPRVRRRRGRRAGAPPRRDRGHRDHRRGVGATGRPTRVAGCLWRLYLLRSWVYADPVAVAREFDAGRAHATVDDVIAGVADPPGPDELRAMVDQVLRGIAAATSPTYSSAPRPSPAWWRPDGPPSPRATRSLPRGCSPWPTSSTAPHDWSSPASSPEVRAATAPHRYTGGRCAGPWQPRVPKSAATSGHAP